MTTTPYIIPKIILHQLIEHSKAQTKDLEVSMSSIVQNFFHIKNEDETFPEESFEDVQDITYLQLLKQKLKQKCLDEAHTYKRLHYISIISQIQNQIIRLQHTEISSSHHLLEKVLQEGDILLVSYEAHGTYRNRLLNKSASFLLQFFSKSIFSHIWIVWLHTESWYDRVHSTLDNSQGRTGVKKESLLSYLEERTPLKVLVLRPKYPSLHKKFDFLEYAYKHVENKSAYDTGDAVSDIIWLDLRRDENKFNCGELVYDCMRTIVGDFTISKRWIPASYVDHEIFEPVYLASL